MITASLLLILSARPYQLTISIPSQIYLLDSCAPLVDNFLSQPGEVDQLAARTLFKGQMCAHIEYLILAECFSAACSNLVYDGKKLEKILQHNLGPDTTLMATVKPCILPSYDLDLQQPNIWETGVPSDEVWHTKSTLLWQVCRATAAPPTFLAPGEVSLPNTCGAAQ